MGNSTQLILVRTKELYERYEAFVALGDVRAAALMADEIAFLRALMLDLVNEDEARLGLELTRVA